MSIIQNDITEQICNELAFTYKNLLCEAAESDNHDFGEINRNNNTHMINKISKVSINVNRGTNYGGYGLGQFGNINVLPGSFTGKTNAQKWAMCGLTGATPCSAQVESLLDTTNVNGVKVQMNRVALADFLAIVQEISRIMPTFILKPTSSYRTVQSAGGQSRHMFGVAVDINPGDLGNPWFNHHIKNGEWSVNSPIGSPKPWPIKSNDYPRNQYDPNYCIWSWDHPVVQVFLGHGWGWGGAYGDSMHFSIDTYNTSDGGIGGK